MARITVFGERVLVGGIGARVRLDDGAAALVFGDVLVEDREPRALGDGVTIGRVMLERERPFLLDRDLTDAEEGAVLFALRAAASEYVQTWKAAS